MQTSSRLYHCCRCHAQVVICSRCDRGQRYCAGECRHLARIESSKRAARKYQSSRAGRFNNALRQQRYRTQHKQKVTQQGSIPKRLHDLLKTQPGIAGKAPKPRLSVDGLDCHHCGEACSPFLRNDFMRRHPFKRPFRRR